VGIVQVIAGEGFAEFLEHGHELSARDLVAHLVLVHDGETKALAREAAANKTRTLGEPSDTWSFAVQTKRRVTWAGSTLVVRQSTGFAQIRAIRVLQFGSFQGMEAWTAV
jgi:hypothetical protein